MQSDHEAGQVFGLYHVDWPERQSLMGLAIELDVKPLRPYRCKVASTRFWF